MVDDNPIRSLPLSAVPLKTRKLLSRLLNSPKIIPSDGPERLPRDWRGLAFLANISSQDEMYIRQHTDRTAKLLELWQENSAQATVGELLDHLRRIDRHDVYDDVSSELREAVRNNEIRSVRGNLAVERYNPNNGLVRVYENGNTQSPGVTYHDRPGQLVIYDSVVIYAEQDRRFVDEIIERMTEDGFNLCTVDDLQVGHETQYKPMTELISSRCLSVMLIFSPDFLTNKGTAFYTDFAQAARIESSPEQLVPTVLPIIYRHCDPPVNLKFYLKLYYESQGRPMYQFWHKLSQSLALARMQNGVPLSSTAAVSHQQQQQQAQPIIQTPQTDPQEQPPPRIIGDVMDPRLFVPDKKDTTPVVTVQTLPSNELTTENTREQLVKPKKKKGLTFNIFKTFTGRQKKRKAVV